MLNMTQSDRHIKKTTLAFDHVYKLLKYVHINFPHISPLLESDWWTMWEFQVKGPSGEQIRDFRDKISENFEFTAQNSGVHKFCFTNKSPAHETIDFDVQEDHFSYYDQHAKDGTHLLHY